MDELDDLGPGAAPRSGARRFADGIWRCFLLGVVVGTLELAWWSLTARVGLGVGGWGALVATLAVVNGGLFAVLGVVASVGTLGRAADPAVPAARQLGLVALLGVGTFLLPPALELVERGSRGGAAVFFALPLVGMGFVYFAARWWLRRSARGDRSVPVAPGVFGGHAVVGVLGAGLVAIRAPIGEPVDARHLVFVTVDGLSAGEEGEAWSAFAAEGVRFTQAVAPGGGPRAASAAALVGLHPIRSKVLFEGDALPRGHVSAFEVLEEAGFATGAFLSSAATSVDSGLDQGFGTYDDAFLPAWHRSTLVSRTRRAFGSPPASARRTAGETVDVFEAWFEGRYHRPFAVWLHLSDPAARPGDRAAAEEVDAAIGRVRALLQRHQLLDRTSVVLVGTGGNGDRSGLVAIGDDRVHVPMALRLPEPLQVPVVDAQVRVVDVASTLLDVVELPGLDQSEGVGLVAYGTGLRRAPMNATVLGFEGGAPVLGVRNNGLKFAVLPDGSPRLYDLAKDPREQTDLSGEQPKTTAEATMLTRAERAALDAVLAERR